MQSPIEEMLDHFLIRNVLERYCRGIDRLDAELIDSVYWEDAVDDHGIYVGPGREFAAFIIPMLREQFLATMHLIGQSSIRTSGQRAAAETYFVAYHTRATADGTVVDVAAGRYADTFEKRGEEWRIKDRTVIMDWVETRDGLQDAAFELSQFTVGRRDGNDRSYASYGLLASK